MLKRFYNKIMITFLCVVAAMIVIPSLASAYSREFSDVKKGESHYEAIMELTEAGIIQGYDDGTFGYHNKLQRRHGAVLLYEALGLTTPDDVKGILDQHYDDVSLDNRYADQIAAVTPEIFKGNGGSFHPTADMTREQMATTIVKAFELKDNGSSPGINLDNVDESHKKNVKILAQYEITNQLEDFRPKEIITRGQFATFLYETINIETDVVDFTNYDVNFSKIVDIQANRTPKVDGAGRFIASRELVAYYANSFNFSKDSFEFFQFLSLSHTAGLDAKEINEKVLKGMGSLEGTAEAFIEAGKKYNINEIYLISHALLETGNGASDLATGYPVSEVDGEEVEEKKTYNMYGIGAVDSCPLKCGSEHAYKEEWFTPEAAIIGGAKFVRENYIDRGQDTLYKMRWNPDNPGDHQYATHVSWAVNQTRRMQNIYDLLDTYVMVFDVPKYDNQPSSSAKPTGDAQYAVNTTLSGLIGETTANLNLRTAPTTANSIITTLPKGTEVEILGENGGWYKLKVDGKQGWASGDYIEFNNQLQVINITSSLNVREDPSSSGTIVGSLENNDVVTGVADKDGNLVKKDEWYQIYFDYNDGETAWVHGDYIKEK
jgi:beta-N-acetylglucosaminidase/uncharacterized protein YraI